MVNGKIVVIADDDLLLAQILALRCRQLGMTARLTPTGAGALELVRALEPDLLITDLNVPAPNGLDVCRELAQDDRFAPMPRILLSGNSGSDVEEACRACGTRYVVKDSETWPNIQGHLEEVFHPGGGPSPGGGSRAPKILLVDDDTDVLRAMQLRLRPYRTEVLTAASGIEAFAIATQHHPDVIVTDYSMPHGNGAYLLRRLREERATRGIPVIVLTGWSREGERDYGHERDLQGRCGAAAYLTKPVDFKALLEQLAARVPLFQRSDLPPGVGCAA